jgi:NADH-quinone oxidoreductase subunit N
MNININTLNVFNPLMPIPEITLLLVIVAVIFADLFMPVAHRKVVTWIARGGLIVTAVVLFGVYKFTPLVGPSGHYVHDRLGDIVKFGILLVSFLVFLYAEYYLSMHKLLRSEFYILSLVSILGMMVLVSAHSLLTVYLGVELLSLPLYALIALQRDGHLNKEAAIKYFILGALASAILLFGISILYGATGYITLSEIAGVIPNIVLFEQQMLLAIGVVFVFAGIAFKLGAVPFHMWVPDIYDGAPTAVTALIASASKLAGFVLALRVLVTSLGDLQMDWQPLCFGVAILSIIIGNIVALVQNDVKRLLGYSAISHIGFLLLGIAVGNADGYSAALFYALVYAVMTVGAFGLIILLGHAGMEVQTIDDFKGLAVRNPWLAFLMLLVMFSLAGIPPLAGFYAKFLVLEAVAASHSMWFVGIPLFMSVVGAFYYLRVIKVMYFSAPDNPDKIIYPDSLRYAISANVLAILAIGIIPSPLIAWCQTAFG